MTFPLPLLGLAWIAGLGIVAYLHGYIERRWFA